MKPIIGIIMRPDKLISGNEVMCVYEEIRTSVIGSGGIPLGIIPTTDSLDSIDHSIYKIIDMCDGIILQGGDEFYKYDEVCLEYIYEKDIPVLGICLGMQLMGSIFGGSLENVVKHKCKDRKYVHKVYIDKTSKLYHILKNEVINVNSRHISALNNTDLDIVGLSDNNVIEAIEDKNKKFFIGVQWHPESMYSYDILECNLFDYFIEICRK